MIYSDKFERRMYGKENTVCITSARGLWYILPTPWKPEGLQAKSSVPERENMDKKINHYQLTPQPDKLQRQCAIWKTEAAPTGALYDARALVLTFGQLSYHGFCL